MADLTFDPDDATSVEEWLDNHPPVHKYEATIKFYANSQEELLGLAESLCNNWWHMVVDYGQRDETTQYHRSTSIKLVHANPTQTPENYQDELNRWGHRRQGRG